MRYLYYAILAVLILASSNLYAQQDPHYTQYMYNMNVINPAYAGSKDWLSGGLLYRKQWVDIAGAPSTGTFSLHSPVGEKVGLGFSAIHDEIGPVKKTNAYGDFSYTINLGGEHKLAFGAKAGLTFHDVNLLSEVGPTLPGGGDPAFSEDFSNTYFNVGAGIFYYTNNYYIAASVPHLLKTKHLSIRENGNDMHFGEEVQHFFLAGGYVFNLNDNLKFKPHAMVKGAFDSPVSVDVSANFLLFDRFELGGTYRFDDSFGGLVNIQIIPGLRAGYAYDHTFSNLKVTTYGSHEFVLLFDLMPSKRVSISPRYF